MAGGHLKSLQKYIPNLFYAYLRLRFGSVRFEKVSKKRKTLIGHSRNGWPIIYEVHILYIAHVLSPMAQVSVENNACPLRYSAVFHYLKLTIHAHKNNFHCTLVFPSFFH